MNENESALRDASEHDIPQLCNHHRKMFEEIWGRKGRLIDIAVGEEMEREYSRKLARELPSGSCKAWIIESGGRVVASGAITIVSFVPTPVDLSSKVAYLHSVYTETNMRGKNFAGRIVKAAISYCKTSGIRRVILNASEAGRPVYEKIGFTPYPEMMRLIIEY
ncbi:MAG: GNAT family N-acetyltransferase [Desulfobacteraceae bacterium]|nr:MAG: GNAT family N-acetyltransferase [Desulfobacteraceae bacterium]